MTQGQPPHVLKEILRAKRREVELLKKQIPISVMRERAQTNQPPLNMTGTLMGDDIRVIAEIKKRSPSKGILKKDFDPLVLADDYAKSGAAAISVLTEVDHFDGSIQHLEIVSEQMHPRGLPILRKDFVFDPYQVYETRAHGADSMLLIVAALSAQQLGELLEVAQSIWMQCLVEIHDEKELQIALDAGADMIGINNRDLRTFKTDLTTTEHLAPMVPSGKIIVSESGISTREDTMRARHAGAHAILVGEALVTANDPGAQLRELL